MKHCTRLVQHRGAVGRQAVWALYVCSYFCDAGFCEYVHIFAVLYDSVLREYRILAVCIFYFVANTTPKYDHISVTVYVHIWFYAYVHTWAHRVCSYTADSVYGHTLVCLRMFIHGYSRVCSYTAHAAYDYILPMSLRPIATVNLSLIKRIGHRLMVAAANQNRHSRARGRQTYI